MWNGIRNGIGSMWNGIKSGVSSGVNSVKSTITGIKNSITSFFSDAGSWLINSGRSILDGLKNGILSGINSVKSSISGALSSIRNLFPFSPAKEGPFSGHGWVLYSGMSIMDAMGEGIRENTGVALADAEAGMGKLRAAFAQVNVDPLVIASAKRATLSSSTSGYAKTVPANQGTTVNITNNYPVADPWPLETADDSDHRANGD